MLVRSTKGYHAAWMPSLGYQNPAVAERIAQMLKQALQPDWSAAIPNRDFGRLKRISWTANRPSQPG